MFERTALSQRSRNTSKTQRRALFSKPTSLLEQAVHTVQTTAKSHSHDIGSSSTSRGLLPVSTARVYKMSAQSGVAASTGTICRGFNEAMEQMSDAWDTVKTTQIEIFELNLLLKSLSMVSSSDTALQAIHQDLELKNDLASATYDRHSEAAPKITDLQICLEDATRTNPPVCQVSRSHNCRFSRPVSDSNCFNIYHRFRKIYRQDPAKKLGPFGCKVSNHRIVSFSDIQDDTKSMLGNGHTSLSVVVDADGNRSNHRAQIVGEVAKGENLDLWTLMEARFFYSTCIES